jgi:CHAT domain
VAWFRRTPRADDVALPAAEDALGWAARGDAAFDAAKSADPAGMRVAADAYRRSLALTPADDPALDERTVNLALSLSVLGRRTGDLPVLDEAIAQFDAVLARTSPDDDRLALRYSGIAVALTTRGHLRAEPADLARADASIALIPQGSGQRASAHFLIGEEWIAQFARSNAGADLDRAIEEFRLAVATSVAGDQRVGGRRARFAMLLAGRAAALGDEMQQAEVIDQLRLSRDGLAAGEIRDAMIVRLGGLLLQRPTRLDDTGLDEGAAAARLSAAPGATETDLVGMAISVSRRLRIRADDAASEPLGDFDQFYLRAIDLLEHRRVTADGADRVALVTELAAVFTARSDRRRETGPLVSAIEVLRDQLDRLATSHDPSRGELHRLLAAAHSRHFERFGAAAHLGAAIRHGETAVALAISDEDLIDALDTLGVARLLAALAGADYDSLDDISESCFQRAIALSGGASAQPGLLNDAALALREAGTHRHDPAKLDQAITLLRAAVSAEPEPAALTNLANALGDRYHFDSDLSMLDEAVEAARAAVAGTSRADGYRASRLANLGHQLVDRYQAARRDDDSADLDDAVAAYLQAIAEEHPRAPAAAGHVAALATAVRYRYWATGDREDLRTACRCDAAAVDHTPPAAAERPKRLAGLSASLFARWEADHDPADLDAAIDALANALALAGHADVVRVNLAARLGDAYAHRSRRGDDADAHLARQWFAHSLELAEHRGGEYTSGLEAARFWQSWAARHARWGEAAEAGRRGVRFAAQIDRQQVTRADRETRLGRVGALAAETAYALVQLDEREAAIVTVESARAVLLSDSLQLDDPELAALEATAPELVAAYRKADERRRTMIRPAAPGSEVTASDRAQARSTRAEFDAALAAIRRVAGYERFRAEPTFAAIAAAADLPVVYLVPARAGGVALIVADGAVDEVALPELRRDRLERHAAGYVDAYLASRGAPEHRVAWHHALDEITAWLWDAVMGPLITGLGERSRVRVVAAGRLAVLPLHVAWTPDARRPTARRYALDELTISFAPNARSLAGRRGTPVPARGALALVEPRPVPAGPLPGAQFEALAMAAAAPVDVTTVPGGAATRRRFLRESARAEVLHLACHAYADLSSPLDSGLLLADGPFRLRDLLHAGPIDARLAVLSACGSGIVGARLPDESVALPNGLVQAGVAGVIATQWSVSDRDAAMLMAEFYQRWEWGACPVADALRASQQWLRDTTNGDKRRTWTTRAAAGTLPREVAEFFADTTLGLEPAEREHAHVQSWGSFTHTGI